MLTKPRAICAFLQLTLVWLLSILAPTCSPTWASTEKFRFYYLGSEKSVLDRLLLDPSAERTSTLSQAQTVVVQEALPAPGRELELLKTQVEQGTGMLLILGEHTPSASVAFLTDNALTQSAQVNVGGGKGRAQRLEEIAAILQYVGPPTSALASQANWRSAGRVYQRTVVRLSSSTRTRGEVLVATARSDRVSPGTPILLRLEIAKGRIYVLTTWLQPATQTTQSVGLLELLSLNETGENYELQRWPYFNWLLYFLSRDAARLKVSNFSQWVASPVPKRGDVVVLAIFLITICALLSVAFVIVRRTSLNHPEKLLEVRLPVASGRQAPKRSLESDPQLDESSANNAFRYAVSNKLRGDRSDPRWELIGFHRPLSGFLYNYLLALFVMIPFNFATTFYIERNFINPFVEARGAAAAVSQFMPFFFALLDLGTGQAMVKYFAEFRVTDPARAIAYAQFFVWFHALTGSLAVTALALGAAVWLPRTSMAFLAWLVVLHAYTLFPGFVSIFFNFFRALQRFDYSQFLIVLTYVLAPVPSMVCSLLGRKWGLAHPIYGEGMGAAFGAAIGGVIANLSIAALCALFYRAVGFKLSTLFLAHFDRDTVRRSLIYGFKLTLGSLITALSWALIPLLMVLALPDFLELNELWVICYMLTFAYIETGTYIFITLMPSISESYSHGMLGLTRYYLDQGLRWGAMVTTMLGGAFIAFSAVMVHGLLPAQFSRVAQVLFLAHLWRAIDFAGRLPDQVFQGVGNTGLFTWAAALEHGSRIVLAWALMKHFGFPGLFYAFGLSSLLKAVVGWTLMVSRVITPALSVWQTLVNPLLSGIASYSILATIVRLLPSGADHPIGSWALVAICLFGSLPIYMFLTGLFGWDNQTLAEFKDAAELVPAPFTNLARMAFRMVAVGTMISPLHERFATNAGRVALAEAHELTARKVPLC